MSARTCKELGFGQGDYDALDVLPIYFERFRVASALHESILA